MIPDEAQLAAELLRVRCEQDDGDPFMWREAPRAAVSPVDAPDAPQGPASGTSPARGRLARFLGRRRATASAETSASTPVPPSRPLTGSRSAQQPVGVEPELWGSGAQRGGQGRDGTKAAPNTPTGDPR